ncbi:Cyclohex-1-ene-1-carbonyl-CoA dehydrogenase [Baekduia alba]|uniref:acyl-CoA dehydrogenase family protein n=1 Tax=Baekduia alba TaxID=2997333 RepID=UPI00234033BA|nr:acyl-CoA dehydrogenase family protein [Baekduia alba]WCB91429.1 Cyclohex-1-ene-1-carbonyl-CoA dehydrogenase [Baekduia alba]
MTVAADRDAAFLAGIDQLADAIAAVHADDVDRGARFPTETIDALREQRALSALVPAEYGGDGISFEAVAQACFVLGRRCGASAMVFAMHQIQVATIVRHLDGSPWFEDYLRELVADQRLIASVTSEVGTGGDMSRSVAALTPIDGDPARATFEKQAPTVSYGAYADDLLVTLRASPDAGPGDQVAVLARQSDTTLEPTGTWDPLGMRGTCSPGYVVRAEVPVAQVMGAPFPSISTESMVPISHLLWSHIWLGIATDAFDRARAFVRAAARRAPGEPVPAAMKLSHVMTQLSLLRAEVHSAMQDWTEAEADRERLSTMAFALRFNNLKLAASEQAPRVCQQAMGVCGIVGFKNDTPFSIGRHLRDSMSASLMVANERIHQTNAGLLLIAKEV